HRAEEGRGADRPALRNALARPGPGQHSSPVERRRERLRDLDGGAGPRATAHTARRRFAVPAAEAQGGDAVSAFDWMPPAKPIGSEQYFEDFALDDVFRANPVSISEDEIVEFARRYDPQPFHVDKAAAAGSQFGGLIASGMHVMSASFASMIEAGVLRGGGMGSPGLGGPRWGGAGRPGGTVGVRARVVGRKGPAARARGRR